MATANSRKKSRMNVWRSVGILALGLMMLGAAATQASVAFNLVLDGRDPVTLITTKTANLPNETLVTFAGTITNTSNPGETIYLSYDIGPSAAFNGTIPSWAVPEIVDTLPLQDAWFSPPQPTDRALAAGDSWHGTLFTLYVGGVTLDYPPADLLTGTFTVTMDNGHYDGNGDWVPATSAASQAPAFSLQLIPEPASLALLGLGLLGLVRRPRKVLR